MASNGTPQGYLNSIIQRNNNSQIRDRTMEQDGTNSGNPYGYIPQLPNQQVPGSYPNNRYIPPTMTGVDGTWNQTGLTYSLPTAYNPYGQGGTPYGPQQLQPYMPSFYYKGQGGAVPPGQGQMPVGQQGPQPTSAAGAKPPVGVSGGTFQQAPTQVGPTQNAAPNANQQHRFDPDNRPQPGDFYKGNIPQFRRPYNLSQSPATNNLANAMQNFAGAAGNPQYPQGATLPQITQNYVPAQQPITNATTGMGGGPGLGPQPYNPYQVPLFNSPGFQRPIGNVIS